ncbi:hypothetical protein [Blastochloris tepida]|uniref:DNA-binding protein n=1 Tax=Blastochloris tepida TaxID=2233851 RepID=A0A348G1B9_9HYPH|nr:hypothetical protein [Blastochloris tepida]BBF93352.1 hypothetical protein BLTE_20370 [Blastochloris tepida]
MSETQKLLREIEEFVRVSPMSETTFGRKAVNDGKLVPRLRAGGSVTLEKAADIRRFIAANAATVAGHSPAVSANRDAEITGGAA